MLDFVKISKANLEMMKEIKEMSGLSLSVLETFHELQKGIMAEQNAKMDMLINRLDRQEWFMKKMAQMLFGESFEKFGDFGSYPHENPPYLILKATAAVKMEKVKVEMVHDKKRRRKMLAIRKKSSHKTHPLINQTLLLLPLNQYPNHPSPYPCNMALGEPKHKPESVLPIPPTIQVTMPEKDPPKNKKQAKAIDPTYLRRSGRILGSKDKP
ncbi:hypothetical protein GH714_031137 [Hevea brasiliensis]|uniref:Uncharacterized protein n=1 Tax=Hevea brasiliensis TaxID=3981 RepID=A0A6A6NDE2_HEVBR|nr:hypothetical protein GH714_031137 [Hevea brasiliensis]